MKKADLIYAEEVYCIIGAAMDVHKNLGCGFLEAVYEEALIMEFGLRNIPFEQQKQLCIFYKGERLKKYYVADLICYYKIIVELKALSSLTSEHEAQVLNYLKTTNFKVGILLNFGTRSLQYKRLVL